MKKISKMFGVVGATVILAGALLSQNAEANQIQGTITFGGSAVVNTNSLATATAVTSWPLAFVTDDSDDFALFVTPGVTALTITSPWVFNPSTPTDPLWTAGGFTFDLASATIVSQSATFLNISGVGTLSGNGFDETSGLWSFTISQSDGSTRAKFGFQANTTAVPDGGSAVALLGFALVGVEGLRRKLMA